MTNLQGTQPRHVSHISVVVLFVLAVAAMLGAFAVAARAADGDDPTRDYAVAIVLAVIGAGVIIVAALYDLLAEH